MSEATRTFHDFTGLWKTMNETHVTIIWEETGWRGYKPKSAISLGWWDHNGNHEFDRGLDLQQRLSGFCTHVPEKD